MNKPVSCRYFYGDYFRGKHKEECRLVAANANNAYPWKRSCCDSCPVPAVLVASNSRDLALEAKVTRRFLSSRVEISFAVCTRHLEELADPRFCPQCAAEQESASQS
ncbi:MAG: hypothetical protein ACKO9F_13360 [Caldilinea sp.]